MNAASTPRPALLLLLALILVATPDTRAGSFTTGGATSLDAAPVPVGPGSPQEVIKEVGFDQKLGAQVPLDAVFRDERGAPVRLGDLCHGERPAVLVLGYKECPMLCSLVLSGLTETLNELRATTGRQFDLIDLSLDPTQSPTDAAAQKRLYFKRYARTGADAGWHFLTGDEPEIRRVADAVGFRYRFDPATKQYAHAAGLVVLTPAGQVSKYLFGVNFDPPELYNAIASASASRVGSPIERLLLLCFHYNPIQGRYGALIQSAFRVGGVLTLLAMGGLIFALVRREQRRSRGAENRSRLPSPV